MHKRDFTFKLAQGALLALALTSAALPASAADLLATVKARGTLKVALEGTYPPFNYKDQKSGELAGYDVDVARLLAGKLGVKVEFVSSEWAGILAGLSANKYDVIISQVGINPKREQAFDFSAPYIYSMPQLIVRKDEKAVYKALADLKGKKLGVGQGSVYEQQAKAVPGIEVRSYAAAPDTMSDLAFGRIDAALNDSLMSAYLLKISKLPIKAGAQVGAVERMGIPFQKGNPQFKEALNKALAEAAADGSLKAISLKWFGTDVSKAP
ncbi:cystine ABC transporter substrate-binding protein [Duganella sp. BJB488]|uniref:transporter substrate-binding domain-containing protein n=1 Tax=unclassified Duganella TaxID=2636909 RepID=UPI000E3473D1|nr:MULTISPECIES: transporter substrate-binding domain-containing protein [unclassified Duganella]RFP08772.1 cystine ABC transporter substrate-binding protein [Duganella sp. BJB489]RFP18188.1 cystine ABC transporter substrate-binding protein [Duganella sp. BJB488]RFP37949.1 cystine ABC transporter substrate-binding protein [Duganella sp. BJB480]